MGSPLLLNTIACLENWVVSLNAQRGTRGVHTAPQARGSPEPVEQRQWHSRGGP